jgi:hypothetical protein
MEVPLPQLRTLSACTRLRFPFGKIIDRWCYYTNLTKTSPELTWRDLQHLTVRTAEIINPDDPDWETTAAGRKFSYKYGYGRLNGYAFVQAAKEWELVKPQAWMEKPAVQVGEGTCDVVGNMEGGELIVPGGLQHTITITQDDLHMYNFQSLEHVTVRVWITHSRRGDVEVEIISPSGVKSILAANRKGDAADSGFPGWRFMTVKHWCVFVTVSGVQSTQKGKHSFQGREPRRRLDDPRRRRRR